MLRLSQDLLGRPVMSLRTGQAVATVTAAIFNPNNLKIEGFYCSDRFQRKTELVLLYQDIRDIVSQGFVVNDHDVLARPEELVRLKNILELGFELIGKQVIDLSKHKIGKVNDYAVETDSMYVQKIYLSQSMIKSLSGGSLVVDRTQINEITDKAIIINDPLEGGAVRVGAPA